MTLVSVAAAIVTAGLCIFLDNYLGILAYIFFGVPGMLCVMIGLIGVFNARSHTFLFDRTVGQFKASAGQAALMKRLAEIRVVMVERRLGSTTPGGMDSLGGGPNTFAVSLLFEDSRRCRLEGGVASSSHETGPPPDLVANAELIMNFLGLPQSQVAVLDVTRAMKALEQDEQHSSQVVSRFFACKAEAPQLEPIIYDYEWVVPPDCPLPRQPPPPAGTRPSQIGHMQVVAVGPLGRGPMGDPYGDPRYGDPRYGDPYGAAMVRGPGPAAGSTPIVMGQPLRQQPAPTPQRQMQVMVPANASPGQVITAQAPTGETVQVTLPQGAQPGGTITLAY